MKHKSRRIKPILTGMAITFVAVFFILSFQATARAAQPMVAAGYVHTVGLKSDGTVVAVGNNDCGQCNVSSWTDIVQVAAGVWHTVGLKSDGTVVTVGFNGHGQCNVSSWTDIVQVAASCCHTVGLKSDGTVVTVGFNDYGQCNVSSMTDIVQVAAGCCHTVGLKSDGTVVAVGRNHCGQCDVSSWTDIVQVSSGWNHTVGLKSDGTVVAVGFNAYGQCNVSSMTDIVQVAAGYEHTVGLKSDGTVVAVGFNDYGQCNVSDWNLSDQMSATGSVEGIVTDFATGAPIENAEVCVGGNSHCDQTDSNGYYLIEGIPVGEYQICASHPDYETHCEAIQIIEDLTIEKNFELSSADLYVDLSVSSSDVVVEPKISSGDTSFGFIKLTASVKNIGQRGAENVNVSFYRVTETGKELIGIVPTPRIAAGDSVSVEKNMDAANLVTSYIIVEADNDEDKNQDNNIAVKQIDGLELLGDFECHLPSSGTCVPTAQAEVMDYLKIYSPGCGWFDCLYNFFCHWGDDIMFCSSCEEMKSGKDTSGLCLYLSTLRWIKENGPGFYLDSGFWADWEAIKSCINGGFPVIAELPGHVTPIIGYWEYDGSKYALSCGGNGKLFRELDETPPLGTTILAVLPRTGAVAGPIMIVAFCPVDLIITDPDGLTISKTLIEIQNAIYTEDDVNGDGDPDDVILILDRKIGNYSITVAPEPDAEPTDLYSLEVLADDTTVVLAQNVPVSDIPDHPYVIISTEEGIYAFYTDTDGDGIPDNVDNCPESNLERTIIIVGCDSGVENFLFEDGCTMSDLIAECADGANNHGEFVSCVSHLTNDWKEQKLISGEEKDSIQSCAAQADIP